MTTPICFASVAESRYVEGPFEPEVSGAIVTAFEGGEAWTLSIEGGQIGIHTLPSLVFVRYQTEGETIASATVPITDGLEMFGEVGAVLADGDQGFVVGSMGGKTIAIARVLGYESLTEEEISTLESTPTGQLNWDTLSGDEPESGVIAMPTHLGMAMTI